MKKGSLNNVVMAFLKKFTAMFKFAVQGHETTLTFPWFSYEVTSIWV